MKTNKKTAKSKAAVVLGQSGGKAVFRNRGRGHMSKIGKLGANSRWGK